MTETQREEYRSAARERKRKSSKKMYSKYISPKMLKNTSMTPVNAYSSRHFFGRARQRSRKSLPMSPSKRTAVV